MKGIIIWEDNERATYCEFINNAHTELTQYAPKTIICSLKGESLESSKAVCSKDDKYDFETGALISLMKMCGLEKSAKAYAEIFDDTAYGDALIERDKLREENKRLKAAIHAKKVLNAKLLKDYNSAQSAYEIMVEKSADLMDQVKKLEKEKDEIFESDKYAKSEVGRLSLEKHRLEEENKLLKEKNAELVKGNSALVGARDYLLNESMRRLRDKKDLKEKYVALVAENEKLKLDCEKLQHGYNDTDMIFCGGRQNGKQYTLLVDLFKKIDQKKVDAAYKEAYNKWTALTLDPISPLSSKCPSWLDGKKWDYISIDEWGKRPSNLFTISKREKMWDGILKEGRTPVYVKRKDFHDFLEECQVAGIKWASGKLPLEGMPFYMTDGYEGAYFFVMTSLDISKSKRGAKEFRHVMTWWATACPEEVEAAINYIRPMRWDLFEKGRIAVKVSKENYAEFGGKILSHFTKVRISAFNHSCKYGYFVFNKDTNYVDRILVSNNGDVKEINGHKIVDWEEVR